MKKSLALLTAFVIASVHQTLLGETSGDWTYSVTDNQATITGYSGDDTEVVIPAVLNEMAVVKVGDGHPPVFGNPNTSVTSVTIGNSVTSIGASAFAECRGLTSITIGNSVTSIKRDAFRDCSNLTSITIPDSVTSIGTEGFNGCTSLTSVTLPTTLFVEGNYSSYSLSAEQVRVEKTSIDTFVANAETAARTAGQTDVTGDPPTYSLYTSNELVTAEATARALGKDDIINNPTIHGLFGENTVEDVSIGAPMMRKNSEGKLLFDFQIQASDDLQNWTTLDNPEYEVIPSSDKEFLRVRVSNE